MRDPRRQVSSKLIKSKGRADYLICSNSERGQTLPCREGDEVTWKSEGGRAERGGLDREACAEEECLYLTKVFGRERAHALTNRSVEGG